MRFSTQRLAIAALTLSVGWHPAILAVLLMLVVALVLLVLPGRRRPWASWLVALLALAALYADLVYSRYFGDILSSSVLVAAGQAVQVRASVASLLEARDLWLLLLLGSGLVLAAAVVSVQRRQDRRPAVALGVLLLPVIAVGVGSAVTVARSDSGVLHQVFRSVFVAREIGVLNFHLLDLGQHLRHQVLRPEASDEQVQRVTQWFSSRAPLRRGTGSWFGRARGANLVMVQVESLQAFVIGFEVGGQEITPALNRWVGSSLW